VNGFVPNDNRLHYIFPFLITLFFYRSHGKQYTLPILSERLISGLSITKQQVFLLIRPKGQLLF
ncbi:hypothetical protein, partial [endosymbiont of Ridgeia piscesae]|uniref:hypothetical protein n=1 Tax=endosymbiont of Ridgeia piscesae TaxID=54398 RepID=UPI001F36CCBB